MIYGLHGRMFGATFFKKDGSVRKMNCRTGVAKYIKGGGKPLYSYDNLVRVYDIKKKGYRTINIDTLWSLRMNRDTYWIDENISNPKYINRMNP